MYEIKQPGMMMVGEVE